MACKDTCQACKDTCQACKDACQACKDACQACKDTCRACKDAWHSIHKAVCRVICRCTAYNRQYAAIKAEEYGYEQV